MPSDDPIAAEQARQNLSTQGQWVLFASHRRQIERLMVPRGPRGAGRICVMGAGNCNDLDLCWLAEVYREVHLVDIDPAALEAAVQRQKVAALTSIHRHAPIDLTGMADEAARWARAAPGAAEIEATTRRLLAAPLTPLDSLGAFDLVLSPCVLTQLSNPIRDALRGHYPPSHPARVAISAELRLHHLRTLAAHLAPGGQAVLLIDLISSEKFPDLPRVPADRLDSFMRTFIADRKHYPGLDPQSLAEARTADAELRRRLGPPRFTPPWLWHLGLRKSFLVYAAIFDRV